MECLKVLGIACFIKKVEYLRSAELTCYKRFELNGAKVRAVTNDNVIGQLDNCRVNLTLVLSF